MNSYARQIMMSDLRAIRAQMNPHFIFNSLNSINRYILRNEPEVASDYLSRFAKLMRLVLDNSNHERIPLRSELETMKLYVELEQLRFEHTFEYIAEVDPELDQQKVLIQPLILQPFLENSIWHGLMHKEHGDRKLWLKISQNNRDLICEITDNGVGRSNATESSAQMKGSKRKSYGINLVRDRLKSIDRNAQIEITDLKDDSGKPTGTRVFIRFMKTENFTF